MNGATLATMSVRGYFIRLPALFYSKALNLVCKPSEMLKHKGSKSESHTDLGTY